MNTQRVTHSSFRSPEGRACTYSGPDMKRKLWFSRARLCRNASHRVTAVDVVVVVIALVVGVAVGYSS